jgi:hypothetical protein
MLFKTTLGLIMQSDIEIAQKAEIKKLAILQRITA